METFVVTQPGQIITTSEAKLHAKVDFSADDALIDICAKMAQSYIAAETDRLIGEQTIDCFSDCWPEGRELELPLSPIKSVTSVKYLDSDGNEQTLDSSKYVFARGYKSRIWLKTNQSWPTLGDYPQAVRIRIVGGFKRNADSALGETELPFDLLKTLFLLVNHYYEHRELVYTGLQLREYPENLTAKATCAHYQRVNA